MIAGAGHRADPIRTRCQTTSNSGVESTLAIAIIIDTLEEGEDCWIRWRAGGDAVSKGLDCDVGVANDVAVLECLRCGVVSRIWVGE